MNRISPIFSCSLLAVLLTVVPSASCKVPSVNLALSLKAEEGTSLFSRERLVTSLDTELRIRGFAGRMRVLGCGTEEIASGESLIQVTIRRFFWKSQKAFSIPYLLNRYRPVFILEAFMEIPGGIHGMFSEMIEVKCSSAVQAQLMSNDRYDPDLLLDQSERIRLEETVYRKLARRLAKHLSDNLE
jgi:hypothetical protein